MKNEYTRDGKLCVWLDVDYDADEGTLCIITVYPPFITHRTRKEYTAVEGERLVYMVKGFSNTSDARSFAITYHKAKEDGFVSRYRLD